MNIIKKITNFFTPKMNLVYQDKNGDIDSVSASRIFIALLGLKEGEEFEVKDDITEDDRLFRPLYLPCLITPKEEEIIGELVS